MQHFYLQMCERMFTSCISVSDFYLYATQNIQLLFFPLFHISLNKETYEERPVVSLFFEPDIEMGIFLTALALYPVRQQTLRPAFFFSFRTKQ